MQINKRKKRGAIDLVGNIANAVFGVLDSEYAKNMAQTIQQLKNDDKHLLNLLKNQTSILDSTLNIMKRNQQQYQTTFELTVERLNDVKAKMLEEDKEIYNLKLHQFFTAISTQLLSVTTSIQFYESAILGVLTDTNHGKISPLLLTPKQLMNEVTTMREHLRSTMQLPVNMSNISELYSRMTVSSGLFDTKMLFQITLPLINDQSFDLFVVIPVPGIINGEYVTITPCTSMMAFNTHRNGYFPISEIQLAQCVSSKNDIFICSDTQEIYSLESGKCTCEVNLFNNSTSSCTWQSFTSNTLWIQSVAQNQWMFVARNPVKLNSVCDNEHSQVIQVYLSSHQGAYSHIIRQQ
ncbi:uncharacterized protein LOC119663179 [Teleopsis dalmanni]|uniref:uncharacterized protein LOC119663179 n=1 Tax=Teleopsis dalmanni TaxID=139649 RepID=UPI0018CD912E|nr:uncharacterized protein LOC119663179 [Teleopsis dalmanni]